MDADYSLAIATSLADGARPKGDALVINARKTDLRWTIGDEGGYLDLECGIAQDAGWPLVGYLPRLMDVEFRDHVVVRRGARIVWEGRVVEIDRGAGGLCRGFIAEGYVAALDDDWSRDLSTASLTSGAILTNVLAAVAPDIRIGNAEQWVDPNVLHEQTLVDIGGGVFENRGGMRDVYKLTAGEAVDLILKEGTAAQQPLVFMVLADRTAWLLPKVAPAEPHYTTAFDPDRMTWRETAANMVSHVAVEYQVEINAGDKTVTLDLTTEADTAGFLDAWGFSRHKLLAAGTMLAAGAQALRDTTLTRGATPEVAATIVAGADPATWLTRGRALAPFDAVIPSEWVAVAERGLQPIVAVSVDASGSTATYELGQLNPILPKNLFIKERRARQRHERALNAHGGRTR